MKKYEKVVNVLFGKRSLYVELMIFIVVGILVSLVQPVLWGYLITGLMSSKNQQGIIIISLLFVLYVLSAVFTFAQEKKEAEIKCITGFNLKEKLYMLLFNVKSNEQKKMQSGEFIAILEHDVDEITDVCATQLVNLVVETVKVIVILVLSFVINWKLTLISLFIFPINLLCFCKLGTMINKNEEELRSNIDIYYSRTQEYVNGIIGIKCLGAKEKIKDMLIRTISINKKIGVKNGSVTAFGTSFVGLMDFISLVIIYAYGFFLVKQQELTVELFIAYSSYAAILSASLMAILQFNPVLQKIKVSLKRVEELMKGLEKNKEIWGNKKTNRINQSIKLEKVSFRYDDKEVLKNIEVVLPNKGIVSLVGQNGCGKTTFVEMLLRINEPDQGNIYIDDINVLELEEESFREIFGGYLQNDFLFNMTVKENIMLANPKVTDEEIIYWAKKIGVYDKIMELPLGLDYMVSEQAKNFSGGEIQKICLLRAIVQNTRVLILDEPMSSMDIISKEKVRDVIKELSKDRLIILVSHDISDFYLADIHYQIKDGNIELTTELCKDFD